MLLYMLLSCRNKEVAAIVDTQTGANVLHFAAINPHSTEPCKYLLSSYPELVHKVDSSNALPLHW
jgi:hypothetical protein